MKLLSDTGPSPLLLLRYPRRRTVKTKIARQRIDTRGDVAAFQPLEHPPPPRSRHEDRKIEETTAMIARPRIFYHRVNVRFIHDRFFIGEDRMSRRVVR